MHWHHLQVVHPHRLHACVAGGVEAGSFAASPSGGVAVVASALQHCCRPLRQRERRLSLQRRLSQQVRLASAGLSAHWPRGQSLLPAVLVRFPWLHHHRSTLRLRSGVSDFLSLSQLISSDGFGLESTAAGASASGASASGAIMTFGCRPRRFGFGVYRGVPGLALGASPAG